MRYFHGIDPVFDERSEILILGSFPSVKSREGMFFYHNPQNRFWRVLSAVLAFPEPVTTADKRAMLLKNRIALWDVAASCEIRGSDDGSISDVLPNDLTRITSSAKIRHVFTNGGAADRLYLRYGFAQTGITARRLPSTSPANAAFDFERLKKAWSAVAEALKET